MRSLVRRDTGEDYESFVKGLAKSSGVPTPTRKEWVRFDRKRKKKTSNREWVNPHDPEAKITKLKDGADPIGPQGGRGGGPGDGSGGGGNGAGGVGGHTDDGGHTPDGAGGSEGGRLRRRDPGSGGGQGVSQQ